MRTFGRIIGVVFGLFVAASWIFGYMMDSGAVPSDRVQRHDEIEPRHLSVLLEEGIIDPGERIEYFYSEGLMSVREGGSIISDRRVIAWELWDEDDLYVYSIPNGNISDVEQIQEGGTFNYAVYVVTGNGVDDYLELWLPPEHGDDDRFVAAVEAKMQ